MNATNPNNSKNIFFFSLCLFKLVLYWSNCISCLKNTTGNLLSALATRATRMTLLMVSCGSTWQSDLRWKGGPREVSTPVQRERGASAWRCCTGSWPKYSSLSISSRHYFNCRIWSDWWLPCYRRQGRTRCFVWEKRERNVYTPSCWLGHLLSSLYM